MRGASSLGLLASAGIVGISSAALTAVDIATASANGWDTRTEGNGCVPDGCIASNAIDGSVEYDSRWSCKPGYLDDFEVCELTIELSEPQDMKEIRLALWKGDDRTRLINVLVDGSILTTIESSGTTEGYEPYQATATQVSTIVLQAAGSNDETDNGWLSILDVEIMVESDLAVSPPSPAPTDASYVGCFNDVIDDRIMTSVTIMDDLTSEACSAACREMNHLYYALQQGNECWCAGCDLTDGDTNTAYDRHGLGTCFTPCAGDSSSECGGDMAFSLFLTGNCGPTPAPTVAIFDTSCPADSTPFALQITFTYLVDPDTYINFSVTEPSGTVIFNRNGLGDVGVNTQSSDEATVTYTTMNDLSDDALVIGDYLVRTNGHEDGVPYSLAARVAGEVVLETRGVSVREAQEFTVTVTEYAESDCKLEDIGVCPEDTFSSDGTPPCMACTEARISEAGATTCSVAVFEDFIIDVPDNVAAAILADAVGGFAGPLWFTPLVGNSDTWEFWNLEYHTYEVFAEDGGTLQLTSTFQYQSEDSDTFPPSTALMVYVDSEVEDDLIVGQGLLDSSTGEFSVTVEDLPTGSSKVYFSFSVLDPTHTPQYYGPNAVFYATVAHDDCTWPLTVKVEWATEDLSYRFSTDDWFALYIQEPDGNVVSPSQTGSFGYFPSSASGDETMSYVVYGGDASASGIYTARVYPWVFDDVPFTLTAEVNGVTVWVEEVMWYGSELSSLSYRGWDESPSPFGDFFVTLDSIPAC